MSPVVRRPTRSAQLTGGSIRLDPTPCRHAAPRSVEGWTGEPGTAGRVTVVGAGKMGLPLAVQFATHGWDVHAVDVRREVVDAVNRGESPLTDDEEPGIVELVARVHGEGRLHGSLDAATSVRRSDVVVLIVPVMLDSASKPDFGIMDAAVESILPGLHSGVTVVFETTLPIGTTRQRFTPRLASASGLTPDVDLFVAFSPERLYSGDVIRNLAAYPKLVGGIGPRSGERAAAFYDSVLDAEIVLMSSSEAAEFSKLADTTYRDVNIALANEFAAAAGRAGVDVGEVIAAANSQPYSHIHEPGLGVGGHCIPVYPHFLLATSPDLALVRGAREVNDAAIDFAVGALHAQLGSLGGVEVLVLGLTYRAGVRELAYTRALPLIDALRADGAHVLAFDPMISAKEITDLGVEPWTWGERSNVRAIVTQTADGRWEELDPSWFPSLEVLVDGRNSLRGAGQARWPGYVGVGRGDLMAVPEPA